MGATAATSVLIVEDEQLFAHDLQESLREFGYDVPRIAASAEEAMACIANKCPDVILMDIRIAGPLDGIQTAAMLKQQCPAIIIYLTAYADAAMIERAKRTAPHGYRTALEYYFG